jgi:Na+-transporting NADH:ubiquinone oxidoreductase subunit NqrC
LRHSAVDAISGADLTPKGWERFHDTGK